MILLAMKVLSIWTVVALAAGSGLGARLRTVGRAQGENLLDDLFPTLASQKMTR
jgi:hypothetical protein